MEPIGTSKYRPYYNPNPSSYIPSQSTRIIDASIDKSNADLAELSTGESTMDTAYDLFRAQCLQYIGLAIAQPFENAKILLQCQYIPSQLANAPTDTAADVEE